MNLLNQDSQQKDKLFVIMLNKVDSLPLDKNLIAKHVAHIKTLFKLKKLVLCGPFLDLPSGIIILNVDSKNEAIEIAKSDPFVIEGVRTYEVHTLLVAGPENNFLEN